MRVSTPLVSIIIPFYNGDNYIRDTLHSCFNQSYKNIEIIVINDSSSIHSTKFLNDFVDDRLKIINLNQNVGPQKARNLGIQVANGLLLQFLDHDDVLDENKIFYQVRLYEIFGDKFLYSSRQGHISNGEKHLDKSFSIYYKSFLPLNYFLVCSNQFGKYLTTGNWLIPRKIISKTHGWDPNAGINDDGEYFMRIILSSQGIKFSKNSIFYFRTDSFNSLSKSRNNFIKYNKWFYSYQSYSYYFKIYFTNEQYKLLSLNYFSKFFCYGFPLTKKIRELCLLEIRKLGYNSPLPFGSFKFVLISKLIGTNNALKLRYCIKLKRRIKIP
jgi:glycosyltransferase involved in cell wall biosynthesis